MTVVIIMAVGVLIGYFLIPVRLTERLGKVNSWIQMVLVAVLIFMMGLKLGSRENFWQELLSLGWKSAVLAVVPIVLSVALVYPLSRKFLKQDTKKEDV